MKTHDFYYNLPKELIAQEPLADRSASRLLVLDKNTGEITHKTFHDITEYLQKGDCLVINDTRVLPARLWGKRKGTGAKIEVLLLKRHELNKWEVMVRPGKKARPGDIVEFGEGKLTGEILETVEGGNRIISFAFDGVFESLLEELGEMPLPPYITHTLDDKERYQTVYASQDGSAAAPTAGLHFTPELLNELKEKGVFIAHVTLHVGLGTFRPVKAEDILEHKMHEEYFVVEEEQAEIMNQARKNGGRIIGVGTTSARTLETVTDESGFIHAKSGSTGIFIYPGYTFHGIDGLITNFHLPESTLIMLVSAFAGKENVMKAYAEAVAKKYRFFSFGDAMLVLSQHGK